MPYREKLISSSFQSQSPCISRSVHRFAGGITSFAYDVRWVNSAFACLSPAPSSGELWRRDTTQLEDLHRVQRWLILWSRRCDDFPKY